MPIYNFEQDFTPKQPPVPAVGQSSHTQGGRVNVVGDDIQTYPYDVEEFLIPGFRALDSALKHYWSGIRVPTKDSYRFMRVKIAGGDKSLLIWADDLKEGRARLPVASLSRESHEFNAEQFSPTYHRMSARAVNKQGSLAKICYRPVPFKVEYLLTIWTERKRDAEYILYQILTRFHPLAQFRMSDGKMAGEVKLFLGGTSDSSDKEAGFDQQAHVRYEVNFSAESWLPLPEKIVPTVLGKVTTIREDLRRGLLSVVSRAFGVNDG